MSDAGDTASAVLAAARRAPEEASLAEQELAAIDPVAIDGDDERLAFWINLYNARVLRAFGERPRRGSLLRHRRLFDQYGYTVGGNVFSLNVIEHGLLRRNARRPLALRRELTDDDPRLAAAPSRVDPRIHFALNCGAVSCPPIAAYDAEEIDHQLELATRSYLAAELVVEDEKVTLPYLLKLYGTDFGSKEDALAFALEHAPEEEAAELRRRGEAPTVGYGSYDWTITDWR